MREIKRLLISLGICSCIVLSACSAAGSSQSESIGIETSNTKIFETASTTEKDTETDDNTLNDNSERVTEKDTKETKETKNTENATKEKEDSSKEDEGETTLEEKTVEATTQEVTTAHVESGETNENGIVDGQNAGPVETASAVTNASQIVSNLPYVICVNRRANCVTVYGKDSDGRFTVPVKSMICSCGRAGYETPLGTFQIKERYVWRELYGNVYGYYSTRIEGSILFHSVPYYSPTPTQLEIYEYDKLGQGASLGCIRLQVQDSKWIYENIATGTYVIIYDSDDPGPLGKPSAMKTGSSYGIYRGWDPTDPTPGNPWQICLCYIERKAEEVTIKDDAKIKETDYINAYDYEGNPVKVEIEQRTDKDSKNEYTVIYTVSDELGRSFSTSIVFHVKNGGSKETTEEDTEKETKKETTEKETTVKETTVKETTAKETTAKETTAKETTAKETTAKETTAKETTAKETTVKETTAKETTVKETTIKETTVIETTVEETTAAGEIQTTDSEEITEVQLTEEATQAEASLEPETSEKN